MALENAVVRVEIKMDTKWKVAFFGLVMYT
jgi:hypothetical protein